VRGIAVPLGVPCNHEPPDGVKVWGDRGAGVGGASQGGAEGRGRGWGLGRGARGAVGRCCGDRVIAWTGPEAGAEPQAGTGRGGRRGGKWVAFLAAGGSGSMAT